MIHITEKKLRAAIQIALACELEDIDSMESRLVRDIKALSMLTDNTLSDQTRRYIDSAYLTGVFNVAGIDGLQKEITRLKEIRKNPHDIFSP